MTASMARPHTVAEPSTGFEVSTLASDTLRAGIRVSGTVERRTVALLVCILHTHLAAGRRYLRVDVADAAVADADAVAALEYCHDRVSELGGMLAFENAGPAVLAALDPARLFVRAADV